jgi:hypothetical protein
MVTWQDALKLAGGITTKEAIDWVNSPNVGVVEKTQVAKALGLPDTSAAGLKSWAAKNAPSATQTTTPTPAVKPTPSAPSNTSYTPPDAILAPKMGLYAPLGDVKTYFENTPYTQMKTDFTKQGWDNQQVANVYNKTYGGNITAQDVENYITSGTIPGGGTAAGSGGTGGSSSGGTGGGTSGQGFSKLNTADDPYTVSINGQSLLAYQSGNNWYIFTPDGKSTNYMVDGNGDVFDGAQKIGTITADPNGGGKLVVTNADGTDFVGSFSPHSDPAWLEVYNQIQDIIADMQGTQQTNSQSYQDAIDSLQSYITNNPLNNSAALQKYLDSINDYSGNVDKYVQSAKEAATSSGKQAMNYAGQDVLNKMASKNMLKSSVTGDTMSKAISDIASQMANAHLGAEMQGAQMKGNIPTMYGNAANQQLAGDTAQASILGGLIDATGNKSNITGGQYAQQLNFFNALLNALETNELKYLPAV